MPLSVYKEDKTMAENKFDQLVNDNMTNCDTARFMKEAYKLRGVVERFETATQIKAIRAERFTYEGNETEEEKNDKAKTFMREKWSKIATACFGDNFEITKEMLAAMCFTEPAEIDELKPYELHNLLFLILSNERLNDFFTSLQLWGLIDSDKL